MGNRDINKLRLIFEMKKLDRRSIEDFRIPSWHDDFKNYMSQQDIEYKHGKDTTETAVATDKMLLFKFLLEKTMGAGRAFENFKKENKIVNELIVWEEILTAIGRKFIY